jgi:hypothetical protein
VIVAASLSFQDFTMAQNYFFKGRTGAQNGPVSFEELVIIAKSGRIAPDCLVWAEGGEPASARQFPGLTEIFGGSAIFATPTGSGPLIGNIPGWGLLWRGCIMGLGIASLVFAPVAGRWFYRFLAGRISMPNGRRLFLDAPLSSCWLLFLGLSVVLLTPIVVLLVLVAQNHVLSGGPEAIKALDLQLFPLRLAAQIAALVLNFLIIRWFVRSLRSEDDALNIAFNGGFWAFFGWDILIILSFITVIGWAWAMQGKWRWMCRRTTGSHTFEFVGSGWNILWRTFCALFGVGFLGGFMGALAGVAKRNGHEGASAILAVFGVAAVVYLFVQAFRWLANWWVSQIVATPNVASAADLKTLAA